MKSLSLTTQNIWSMLKFLKSKSNFKVKVTRSNIMIPIERSCHKEHIYEIPITYTQNIWSMLKFLKSGSNFKVKFTRSNITLPIERSCHKTKGPGATSLTWVILANISHINTCKITFLYCHKITLQENLNFFGSVVSWRDFQRFSLLKQM
jgi:regulation of enolase protein 1 (concanavalin A-like superfamily)